MFDETKTVTCGLHGESIRTYMCRHLVRESGLGFYCSAEGDDEYPDAWCASCNEIMEQEGGWNDVSEAAASITIVCHHCYESAKLRNQIKMSDDDWQALLSESHRYLKERMCDIEDKYDILKYDRFDFDENAGHLVFSRNGRAELKAKCQHIGSLSTKTNTWLWSWGNDGIEEDTREMVRIVRAFGESNALTKLTTAQWNADEYDGWEMTSVAAKLLEAAGAYRAPVEHLFFFVLLTEFEWLASDEAVNH